jgi:RHS repeat-associated protein
VERYEYQDAVTPDVTNLNGQLIRHYNPSGLMETIRRDFKGNVQEVHRTLVQDAVASVVDWQGNPGGKLETETYAQITEHDALNRMTRQNNWHLLGSSGAVYTPTYNERGALKHETVALRGTVTNAIDEIRYNAKGQKESLKLGNGTLTQYEYDKETFRLKQMRTTRLRNGQTEPAFPDLRSNLADSRVIQQLHYTYDPVGNITEIYDEAYKPVFFASVMVEPRSRYEYDALYRLISATGRENSLSSSSPGQFDRQEEVDCPVQDGNALRNYTQRYQYDRVGNIQQMRHVVTSATGSWTRNYDYAFNDPAQPASNRLWRTWEHAPDWNDTGASNKVTYGYDTHGSMLNLADVAPGQHLQWDHRDMIQSLDCIGGGIAYYQYDSSKQRSRKRIANQNGIGGYWERIYLGGYERYRRYNGNGSTVVEEIESHHLFEGDQRVLLVDDVIVTNRTHADGRNYRTGPLYRHQYSNHLGSACLELDHEAAIISYEEYHPYGTSAYRALKRDSEAPVKRYRYTGMERDEESGLSYHTARFYAAWLGRWTAGDPLGIIDSLNVFQYVKGGAASRVDIKGTFTEEFYTEPWQTRAVLDPDNDSPPSIMSPEQLQDMPDAKRKQWYKSQLLQYSDVIDSSAKLHGLPSQLLATVILNELADISCKDVIQEYVDVHEGSVGIAQIQIQTAIDFGLVDVSETEISDFIRKHTISNTDREGYTFEVAPARVDAIKHLVGEKLKTPEIAIEAAARRIEQLLRLALGSPNKFANEFLLAFPSFTADIYSQVDDGGYNSQKAKERRLASLIASAYNSPDILIALNPGDPFDIETPGPYANARIHGVNARGISDDLFEFDLFHSSEKTPVPIVQTPLIVLPPK